MLFFTYYINQSNRHNFLNRHEIHLHCAMKKNFQCFLVTNLLKKHSKFVSEMHEFRKNLVRIDFALK